VLVSIVTPAHDVAAFVADAVRSVRAQSHPGLELILVDDGSRDGTARQAEHAAEGDPRIRILRQGNAGVSAARNAGIAAAKGEALLFLDADDWLATDGLARLVAALAAAPHAVAAYGPWAPMPESTRPGDAPSRVKTGPFPTGDILRRLLRRNLLVNGGHALIRRAAFEAAGGFHPGIRYGEDWECWIRLALRGRFVRVTGNAPLLFVRERAGSAYRRLARDPEAFAPAMAAIWSNPDLAARLGPRLPGLRARAEAENAWVVAKERLRHGTPDALRRLRAAFAAAPTPRRAALLAAAHLLPVLPARFHGPFARYPRATLETADGTIRNT
jgi:glycosyltransferase involved in cell wall biosynthesis